MNTRAKTVLILAGATTAAGVAVYCLRSKPGYSGMKLKKSITVDRPAAELYKFWRDFENLPQIVDMLESVQMLNSTRSHWTMTTPHGIHFRWDVEMTKDVKNEVIGWKSVDGSMIETSGSVRFEPAAGGGTRVRVALEYAPPGGTIGAAIASLLGDGQDALLAEMLRRFKQFMETGKVTRVERATSAA
jgi:uncharacterized membrane protein